eukprot:gene10794-16941_t
MFINATEERNKNKMMAGEEGAGTGDHMPPPTGTKNGEQAEKEDCPASKMSVKTRPVDPTSKLTQPSKPSATPPPLRSRPPSAQHVEWLKKPKCGLDLLAVVALEDSLGKSYHIAEDGTLAWAPGMGGTGRRRRVPRSLTLETGLSANLPPSLDDPERLMRSRKRAKGKGGEMGAGGQVTAAGQWGAGGEGVAGTEQADAKSEGAEEVAGWEGGAATARADAKGWGSRPGLGAVQTGAGGQYQGAVQGRGAEAITLLVPAAADAAQTPGTAPAPFSQLVRSDLYPSISVSAQALAQHWGKEGQEGKEALVAVLLPVRALVAAANAAAESTESGRKTEDRSEQGPSPNPQMSLQEALQVVAKAALGQLAVTQATGAVAEEKTME